MLKPTTFKQRGYKQRISCKIIKSLTCPSMFLYNQSECFVKGAAPLLLRCNLLLFREELFTLLLPIKHIPLPLHRFSRFLLNSLISSFTSWSSRWIALDKTISISSFTSFSLIAFITFLIFCKVLTIFVMSMVTEWITIIFDSFSGSWSYVINKIFGCCTRMASSFNWTRSWHFPTIHVFYHGTNNDYNIFVISNLFLVFVLTTFIILLPSSNVTVISITVSEAATGCVL